MKKQHIQIGIILLFCVGLTVMIAGFELVSAGIMISIGGLFSVYSYKRRDEMGSFLGASWSGFGILLVLL